MSDIEDNFDLRTVRGHQLFKQCQLQERRKYVEHIIGDYEKGGIIKLQFPEGEVISIKTKNLKKRLEEVFGGLISQKCKGQIFEVLAKKYKFKTIKDLKGIKVSIKYEL